MKITVDLSDEQARILETTAQRLGVRPDHLAQAAFNDLWGRPGEDFQKVADHVLGKNQELYKRLA